MTITAVSTRTCSLAGREGRPVTRRQPSHLRRSPLARRPAGLEPGRRPAAGVAVPGSAQDVAALSSSPVRGACGSPLREPGTTRAAGLAGRTLLVKTHAMRRFSIAPELAAAG
jgi:hypothetical protein